MVSLAPTLMVQGTTSSAGKSLLVTALCRIFRQAGIAVAPFKAQNMALNSAVTPDGLEIGRAQAVQAEAAEIVPSVDMNPILLKPEADYRSQVVLLGKVLGSMTVHEYYERKPLLKTVVSDALERLRRKYQLVIIEGAGSPAEVNLKDHDIVNMFIAQVAGAPVLMVGDIDRGGVFASFVGTMALLEPEERSRIIGFVVNKFRGDRLLLEPGLEFLHRRTGIPVVGVIPFIPGLQIADEDSLSLESHMSKKPSSPNSIDIAVVCLPHISNYDDVLPLENVEGVTVRFLTNPTEVENADLMILPGSKSTVSDLDWLRNIGFADVIRDRANSGKPIMGLCGGCQMLGQSIHDPDGVESAIPYARGLNLLPLKTRFARSKITAQVAFKVRREGFWGTVKDQDLHGYEIHMGVVEQTRKAVAPFEIVMRNGTSTMIPDGASDQSGTVMGTMIHGLFGNRPVQQAVIGWLRKRKKIHEQLPTAPPNNAEQYDRIAGLVRANLDLSFISRIAGIPSVKVISEPFKVQPT